MEPPNLGPLAQCTESQPLTSGWWKDIGFYLQNTEGGTGQLSLNPLAPRGVRAEGSSRPKVRLRGAYLSHVQVPGWSVVRGPAFDWLIMPCSSGNSYDGHVGFSQYGGYRKVGLLLGWIPLLGPGSSLNKTPQNSIGQGGICGRSPRPHVSAD